jgi:hypothetical protein
MWVRKGGIVDQTNDVLQKAGASARLSVLDHDDAAAYKDGKGPAREYGDIRYNFIRWESDLDTDSPFMGVTQFQPDLRTGEIISASINIADGPLKDFLAQRTAAYLAKVIGSDPFTDPPADPANPGKTLGSCKVGQSVPVLPSSVAANVYSQSTLFQKMAQYLPPPPNGAKQPGPSDYVFNHSGDDGATFQKAYLKLIPYITYADPMMNQFVTPADLSAPQGMSALRSTLSRETAFQKALSEIDRGKGLADLQIANSRADMQAAYEAVDNFRQLWQSHRDYEAVWQLPHSTMRGDSPSIISFPFTVSRSSRQCVDNGKGPHWATKDEWVDALVQSYYEGLVWHEFGHVMGLEHNFMGSVDKANWPTYKAADGSTQYGKLTSSIMEYSVANDDVNWNNGLGSTGWLPYDTGAIAWIYGNNLAPNDVGPKPVPQGASANGISGQVSATVPWNDPIGFNGNVETEFLFCSHQHIHYTPLCRMFDVGSTPSEITAAEIEMYDWNYQWRNFRNYYKVWDDSQYASQVANIVGETRRFLAMWAWDWNASELTDKLIRVGITPPAGAVNSGLFYAQLVNHFEADVGVAEELIAAFHEAIIQQGTGQRPFLTTHDPAFGDVTQQGISSDKALAFTNWLGLWPYDNYDPSQAAGYLGSAMVMGPGQTHPAQAWSTVGSMLGEKGPWDAYPSFFPEAVALFAHDTQSPTFTGLGYAQMREWIGGHAFTRVQDVLSYFQNIAVQNPQGVNGCKDLATCTYNPMTPQVSASDVGHSDPLYQKFIGPDNRYWTWTYFADRNIWIFVDRDRNPSLYSLVRDYNQDVNVTYDDGNGAGGGNGNNGGNGPVFNFQQRIKYMLDAFAQFGGDTGTR